jgi:hypothetical protein
MFLSTAAFSILLGMVRYTVRALSVGIFFSSYTAQAADWHRAFRSLA